MSSAEIAHVDSDTVCVLDLAYVPGFSVMSKHSLVVHALTSIVRGLKSLFMRQLALNRSGGHAFLARVETSETFYGLSKIAPVMSDRSIDGKFSQ